MKKSLTKSEDELYYLIDGVKVTGKNENMRGYCTGLSGDCTGLREDCSGLSGDLDECEITEEERAKGVNISDLIK